MADEVSEERTKTREDYEPRAWAKAQKMRWNATYRARKRGGTCDLTTQWLADQIEAGVCAQTGLPFSLDPDPHRRNPYSPSLARINHQNPNYTIDNCRVVLSIVNTMQNDATEQDLLLVCLALLKRRNLI